MKIYVINLPESVERKNSIVTQFKKFGITNYEFVTGVDAKTAGISVDQEQFVVNVGRPPVPGEIGCYASHGKILEKIINSKQAGLILEDDVILDSDFLDIYKLLPPKFQFDVIFLYHAPCFETTLEQMFVPLKKHQCVPRTDPTCWLAAAYIISSNFAEKIYRDYYPMKTVADAWDQRWTRKFFATGKEYCHHGVFTSTIEHRDIGSPQFGKYVL